METKSFVSRKDHEQKIKVLGDTLGNLIFLCGELEKRVEKLEEQLSITHKIPTSELFDMGKVQ